jgi:hypothetical protein
MATTTDKIRPPKAPALPFAPVQYAQKYQDDFANVLRLYFTQVDATFTSMLDVSNQIYAVAKLPSAADAGLGARAFVTDSSVSTFASTVAGGGSTFVPVYSDGTNWKVG